MDLKDYREMPDEGLFENIEHRVRLRRAAKVTGIVLAATVVVGIALWGVTGGQRPVISDQYAQMGDQWPVTSDQRPVASEPVANDQSPVASEPELVASNQSPVTSVPEPSEIKTEMPMLMSEVAVAEPITLPQEPVASSQWPVASEQELESNDQWSVTSGERPVTSDQSVGTPKSGTQQTAQTENVLWAPNIIAPMADDAANREFKVQSTTAVSNFQLVIYNRGGRKVFSTDDINQSWDGTSGGTVLPQGAYVWVARFRDAEGQLRQEKGSVVIVR